MRGVQDVLFPCNCISHKLFDSFLHIDQLLFHRGVPMVFYCVISSAFKNFRNFRPFVATASVHEVEDPFLFLAPANLFNFGIQMIVPSFSALFANSAWKMLSNQSPFLGSILFDQVKNHLVFLLSPRALNQTRVKHFLPPVKALDISPSWQVFRNLLPVLPSQFSDCL